MVLVTSQRGRVNENRHGVQARLSLYFLLLELVGFNILIISSIVHYQTYTVKLPKVYPAPFPFLSFYQLTFPR
jgi:hypothetical protein